MISEFNFALIVVQVLRINDEFIGYNVRLETSIMLLLHYQEKLEL